MARNLTGKQQLFVAHYLDTLNGTEAVKRAGYKGSYPTLRAIASQNLTKLNIKAAIAEGMKHLAMPREEVIARLSMMSAGALRTGAHDTKDGLMDRFDPMRALELMGKHYGLFSEELVLSWKHQAEEAGISASEMFERMVAEIIVDMTKKASVADTDTG